MQRRHPVTTLRQTRPHKQMSGLVNTEPALWRELLTEDPYLQRLKFPADLFSKLC
jgi:hypothetical protein